VRTGRPGRLLLARTLATDPKVLKLLLISVLFATFLLPAAAASSRMPRRALRNLIASVLLAELAYAFFLRFLYGRLL
jgi:hypothetical protein